jgi:hypothetical protein
VKLSRLFRKLRKTSKRGKRPCKKDWLRRERENIQGEGHRKQDEEIRV